MEENFQVILVEIVGIAFMVGLAALILRIKDRATWTGAIVKRILGAISLFIGLIVAGWIVYNLLYPTEHFRWGPMVFLSLIWVGAKWLFGSEPGLESLDIDRDSAELQAAIQQAKETLPNFIRQVSGGVDQGYVKFPFQTDQGVIEHIWGHVHHYSNGQFTVALANEPFTQGGEYNTWQYVARSDVEDWQIMLPNGKIKGAYSTIGAFRYLENRGRKLSREMQKQKSELVDA